MNDTIPQKFGGIVLCGGKSTRMGQPKAWLPFGSCTLLEHVVGVLQEVVSPIVVVAAEGQRLPTLADDVIIARDEQEGLGPLGGLVVGLSRMRSETDAAYVSSCDAPLLKSVFVQRMIDSLGTHDLAILRDGNHYHPLAGVYRTCLEENVRSLIEQNRLRPLFLLESCNANIIDVQELRTVDPQLDSLRNTNTPEEYKALLKDAGH